MASSTDVKVLENRLRRAAGRQGMTLSKTRRRDPRALDFGHYYLDRDGVRVLDAPDLGDVEAFLLGDS